MNHRISFEIGNPYSDPLEHEPDMASRTRDVAETLTGILKANRYFCNIDKVPSIGSSKYVVTALTGNAEDDDIAIFMANMIMANNLHISLVPESVATDTQIFHETSSLVLSGVSQYRVAEDGWFMRFFFRGTK